MGKTLYMPKGKPRERILGYGGSGAGKSKAWLDIAQALLESDIEGDFYVLDTDYATERMLYDGYPDLVESGRVHVTVPYDGWNDYVGFGKMIKKEMDDSDWAVVDLMDVSWEEAQNHYSNEVYGEDKGDYFVNRRKSMKNPAKENLFEGFTDWNVIKPLYDSFSKAIFYTHRGHTFATAGAAAVSRGGGSFGDSKEVISTFGHVGLKPTGNKRLMHNVHTAILFTQDKKGWHLTTAKDREREMLKNEPVDNFAYDYLRDVAGWKEKGKKKPKMTVAERKAAQKKKGK